VRGRGGGSKGEKRGRWRTGNWQERQRWTQSEQWEWGKRGSGMYVEVYVNKDVTYLVREEAL